MGIKSIIQERYWPTILLFLMELLDFFDLEDSKNMLGFSSFFSGL